jgi:hypothetical protein
MDEYDKKAAFGKVGFKRSIMGVVNICKSGEGWPNHDGVKLLPLLQICIADLPFSKS